MARKRADEPPPLPDLDDFARDVIARRQLSPYSVAKRAGLNPSMLTRFCNRDRSLTVAALSKVWRALGLAGGEGRGGLR